MKSTLMAFAALVVLVVFIGMLIALPVMYLWNSCLVGAISGVSPITFFQAWGLFILSSMLFKSSNTKAS